VLGLRGVNLKRARIESTNVLGLLKDGDHSIIESGWLGIGDLDCNAIVNSM
jgi:hypothetical protein